MTDDMMIQYTYEGTYINPVCLDPGDDDGANWEQRLQIALDAAQGPHFKYAFTLRSYMYVCLTKYELE